MKRAHLFFRGLTLALALTGCAASPAELSQTPEATDIPDEVMSLVEQYMDAYKSGTAESVAYVHFESEFIRSAYIDSGDKLIDYKIEATEKINDDLYSFTLLVKSESSMMYFGDDYQRV